MVYQSTSSPDKPVAKGIGFLSPTFFTGQKTHPDCEVVCESSKLPKSVIGPKFLRQGNAI